MDIFDFTFLHQHFFGIQEIVTYFKTNTIVLIFAILAVYLSMWLAIFLYYKFKDYSRRKRRLNAAKKMIGG